MADTSIYRMLQTAPIPTIDTPEEIEARRISLARMRQQQQLGEQGIRQNELTLRGLALKNAEDERKAQMARQLGEILSGPDDDETKVKKAWALDPNAGMQVEKFYREKQARKLDYEHKRAGMLMEGLEPLAGEEDPDKFAAAYKVQRARLLGTGLFKPEEIPETATREEVFAQIPAEVQQKLRERVPLPERLAKQAGLPAGTMISLQRLEGLERAYAAQKNAESLEEARKNPRPITAQFFQDDAGNVSAVVVKADGTIEAKPVKGAKGRATREGLAASGKLTPAQIQQRYEEIQQEEYGNATRPGIHQVLQSLGEILVTGKERDAKGNQVELTPERRAQIQNRIALLEQKRDALMREKLALGKTTQADIAPRGGPGTGPSLPEEARAKLKEGVVTTFGNGQKWTLRNGQPVFLPN